MVTDIRSIGNTSLFVFITLASKQSLYGQGIRVSCLDAAYLNGLTGLALLVQLRDMERYWMHLPCTLLYGFLALRPDSRCHADKE